MVELSHSLDTVIQGARAGEVQVLGHTPPEQVVVISMADLATLFEAAGADTLSFADALKRIGFQPVRDAGDLKFVQRRRHQKDLRIYGTERASE
jgi:hypothetical protein